MWKPVSRFLKMTQSIIINDSQMIQIADVLRVPWGRALKPGAYKLLTLVLYISQ